LPDERGCKHKTVAEEVMRTTKEKETRARAEDERSKKEQERRENARKEEEARRVEVLVGNLVSPAATLRLWFALRYRLISVSDCPGFFEPSSKIS
jgi:hypothetical protein